MFDQDDVEALRLAAVANGASLPDLTGRSANDRAILIAEAWGGTSRPSLPYSERVVRALEDVAGASTSGPIGLRLVEAVTTKAGTSIRGSLSDSLRDALVAIQGGAGGGGVPAWLTLDGSGSEYVINATPWTGWDGNYPAPAFSAGISVEPAESTPSTAQKILGTDANTRGHILILQAVDGAIYVNVSQSANGATFRRSAAAVTSAGTEIRIAVARGSDTNPPDVYLDGTAVVGTTGSVTDVGGANRFEVFRLGGAGFASFDYFNGKIRAAWRANVKLSAGQVASLDALIAAEDHEGAAAYLLGIDAGAVYLTFKNSDNGANGGRIADENENRDAVPVGTESGDLALVS